MEEFNPNDIGISNGNYFGLPYNIEESEILILPVAWDVTTSYSDGTSAGPKAIEEASLQVDLFDLAYPEAWKIKIGTILVDESIELMNTKYRAIAESIISSLESGKSLESLTPQSAKVNQASENLNNYVYTTVKSLIEKNKIVCVLGGDHSVPFGAIKAIGEKYDNIGVLHIDAHADLRRAYEGFEYSHASIMYNVISKIPAVKSLTQVAIRDFCNDEYQLMNRNETIHPFTDKFLSDSKFNGRSWNEICDDIIVTLPDLIYISFDIDGLSPEFCPSTGTPVPGGISFNEADYLLRRLVESNKKIVGFDLCEVAPSTENGWDANVGARLLYKLCVYTKLSQES